MIERLPFALAGVTTEFGVIMLSSDAIMHLF